SIGIESVSLARNMTAFPSCFGSSVPSTSTTRTPTRFVPMPRRTPLRGSLCSVKNSSRAEASPFTLRTSPFTTTPGSSVVRASCTSFGLPPLLTTRAAAICDAPTFRPTSSLFFDFAFLARGATVALRPGFEPPFFRGFGMRSLSLISFFRSISGLLSQPQAVVVGERQRAAGRVGEASERGVARALEQSRKLIRARRAGERRLGGDHTALDEIGERLLHRQHPARGARLHDRVDLFDLRLSDLIPDGVVRNENLERRNPAAAVGGGHQVLRDDALKGPGELDANLALLPRWKHVDDAVDRLRRTLRVQRREDEVTGLGRGQCSGDRLEVAHLPDE